MDFQNVADSLGAMTCIISVEKIGDNDYGKLCVVAGNKAYIDSIEHPAPGTEMLTDKFTPGLEYTTYLSRDLNFEAACYQAAIQKKCVHSYVQPDRMPVWLDLTFLPLYPDDGNICYCTYTMEINPEPDTKKITSGISAETASSVLETCIKLRGTTDFRTTVKDVIKDIREICDAEHCCVMLMYDLSRTCEVLGESFREGSKLLPMDTYLDESFYDLADSWGETVISGSNCLIAKDEHDMKIVKERNPVWYESLTSASAHNIVLFPLRSRNQLLGYMWALNYDADNATHIKETLELTTFILGSEIANYMLLDRLKILSSKDMLTGVLNRNEMNNLVDELSRDEDSNQSIGVAFTDLNGLKTINDTEGHPAGDLMLKNAANALREVFDEDTIFRAGGDEFSILIKGITPDEMAKKISQVREVSEKYDKVSFAIGFHVEENCKNVRTALRLADENMYKDKAEYYKKFPEKKRVVRDLINIKSASDD